MQPVVALKTSDEVSGIRSSCRIAASILRSVATHIAPGITSGELDRIAAALMRQFGVRPGVAAGFPASICVSVNEVAAHGVPGRLKLREGDIVTVDVAVMAGGWHGDVAAAYGVGQVSTELQNLLDTTRQALAAAIDAARPGSRMGDLGAAVLHTAQTAGLAVLAEFVGHGIGRALHEEPVVPHTGRAGEGLPIVPGMVFTIEPALGLRPMRLSRQSDGWGFRTQDSSPVAQFEHTVAVFSDHTEVLTELMD